MANPPKKLTPKELEEIETMAGLGMRFEDIARLKGMCMDTLQKYAKAELTRGKSKAKAAVMQTAYKMATSGKYPVMTMFWLKTQSGWRENMPQEALTHGEASDGLNTFLERVLEEVKQGHLDPKTASAIASVSNALLKAEEQNQLAERLAALESILSQQKAEPTAAMACEQTIEDVTFEFTSEEAS